MYLAPLKEAGIDTLVLGCTHYPLLYDVINAYLDYQVTLVDSGSEVARYVRGYLASHNLLNSQSSGGSFDFYVSDQVDGFIKTAEFFLGETLSQQVSQVDIDRI